MNMRPWILGALCVAGLAAPAAQAAPSGGVSATVAGIGREIDTDLSAASIGLDEHVDNYVFSADAEARWSMTNGVLNLGTRVSIFGRDMAINPAGHFARGAVTFVDRVNVVAPTLPLGAPLSITLSFAIGGTPSDPWSLHTTEHVPPNWLAPAGGTSAVLFADGIIVDGHPDAFASSGLHDDDFVFEPHLNVQNNMPFDITLQMFTELAGQWALAEELGYVAQYDGYSTSGELDFMHTLTFAGISAIDADGRPLAGVQLWSSSGDVYVEAAAPTPVPEPASWALLLAGLAACAAVLRTRREA